MCVIVLLPSWLRSLSVLIVVCALLVPCALPHPRAADSNELNGNHNYRPGTYVPQQHGADQGKYMPDHRGKYHHVDVPYDGGYGDRGLKYENDGRGVFRRPFTLGRNDHLRFMIDFNYNGSGWQVLQFEWLRDGADERRYNYVREHRLWDAAATIGDDSATNSVGDVSGATNVHVDGEYVTGKGVNVTCIEDDEGGTVASASDGGGHTVHPDDIQNTIRDVLDYVQIHIIPTLN